MRSILLCLVPLALTLVGCSDSHQNDPDSGGVDADVDTGSDASADGGSDAGPDADSGPIVVMCPPDLDPYNPDDPNNTCTQEGATCSQGSQCGGGMFCECTGGRWSCAVAHPDPVCTCGREPSAGDPCVEEGATCGECCPPPGVPAWAPMVCTDGEWQPVGCPPIPCPEIVQECPIDPVAHVGEVCDIPMEMCGDGCCGMGIVCEGGQWQLGPELACACFPGRTCGSGECPSWQVCRQTCGPDDGAIYTCISAPEGCDDCSCIPVEPGQFCEMVDGVPTINSLCG